MNERRWRWIAVAVAWMAMNGAAAAQVTAINGMIAFTVCGLGPSGENCDIWVMNADGSEQRNLTNTPDIREFDPAWSPDAIMIAFLQGDPGVINQVMVMNADGGGVSAVTPIPAAHFGPPSWSPGGTELAFVRLVAGQVITSQFDVLVARVDGTAERNLTNSDGDELDPAWAPDGSRIAFAAVRQEWTIDLETGGRVQAAQWEIVTVNPDGSAEQILTAGEPGTERGDRLEEDRAPEWSPDSSSLVFQSQSVDPCCLPWQIWTVNRDGTGLALLSDNPLVNDQAPAFSPDGTLIVFMSDRDATTPGQHDLYTMPAPGQIAAAAAEVARLTALGNAGNPSWGRKSDVPPPPHRFALTVARTLVRGATGFVTSLPAGIRCGRDCVERYTAGTTVLLVATPGVTSWFAGWTGSCQGRARACVVRMDDARMVRAVFVKRR